MINWQSEDTYLLSIKYHVILNVHDDEVTVRQDNCIWAVKNY